MSVLINGLEMPKDRERALWLVIHSDGTVEYDNNKGFGWQTATAIPVPEHGRLIDADALRQAMYHEAFEMDSPMQKWDSGCWIRYKMFELMEEAAPTIIPADKEGEG